MLPFSGQCAFRWRGEVLVAILHVAVDLRAPYRGFDLGTRTNDARVRHQPLDIPLVKGGDLDRIEIGKGGPKGLALAQDDDPGETRTPPDLLRHSCIRIRLPNGALHRWHFEKNGQPVQIDVAGPITAG